MSITLLSPPIPPESILPAGRRKPTRPMAACIANCLANSAITRASFNLGRAQIDEALYKKCLDQLCPGFHDEAALWRCPGGDTEEDVDEVWAKMRQEARRDVDEEPILCVHYHDAILSHDSFEAALSSYVASKLSSRDGMSKEALGNLFFGLLQQDDSIGRAARADLRAARDRDPACAAMTHCFLYYKGFLALQAHRLAHRLWLDDRVPLALFLHSRAAEVLAVDIHPGARVGSGVLLDHATGVVIGETAVVGDNVSILHNVTLGGTGKASGDRHPKIADGVLVGAGTQILGNIRIGAGAKIGAGSVVLKAVAPGATAVGNPAKEIGPKERPVRPVRPDRLPGLTMDHTSWSDFVI